MVQRSSMALALTLAFLVLPGADTQGCQSQASSDVAQDKIHTTYWAYRDDNVDVTYYRAQFRFGSATGTPLELSGGANVRVNDNTLGWGQLLDWYEYKAPGALAAPRFVYADAEQRRRDVNVPALGDVQFPKDFPSTVSRTKAFEVRWAGAPLATGESMEAVFYEVANRLRFAAVWEFNVGAETVVFNSDALAKLSEGSIGLSLRRHRRDPLPQGADTGGGGWVTTTYQPKDKTLTLVAQ